MKVVLLLGPSSAGKSTICNELQQNRGWHVASGDETLVKIHEEAKGTLHQYLINERVADQLAAYMTLKEIEAVCFTGVLNISKGPHPVKDFKFSSPLYIEAENCLKAVGFKEPALKNLVNALQPVGKFHRVHPLPNLADRLFDQAFDPALKDDDCVVIDMVPEDTIDKTNELLTRYQERSERFQRENSRSVEAITVLAYSPPTELNKRVLKRNEEARATQNTSNLRDGIVSLKQLSRVTSATPSTKSRENSLGQVTRSDLITIAYQHTRKLSTAVRAGINLSKDFGLMKGVASAELTVPAGMKVDRIINTSIGTPKELADQLVETTKTNRPSSKI